MKAMSTTLVIIVAAVVILVTALVLLTIFGTGITPVASLSDARASCTLQGSQLCTSTGALPPTWTLRTMKVGDEVLSCDDAKVCNTGACYHDGQKWVFQCPRARQTGDEYVPTLT